MGTVLKLTAEQAIEIYKYKIEISAQESQTDQGCNKKLRGRSTGLAERYRVCPRTIRDIWNRRLWGNVTRKLWAEEQPGLVQIESSGSTMVKTDSILHTPIQKYPPAKTDSSVS